jgi:hypothetical protein
MLKIMGIALVSGLILGCSGNSDRSSKVTSDEVFSLSGKLNTDSSDTLVTLTGIDSYGAARKIVNDDGVAVFDGFSAVTESDGTYSVEFEEGFVGRTMIMVASKGSGVTRSVCAEVGGCGETSYGGMVTLASSDVENSNGDIFPVDIRAGVSEVLDGMTLNINWLTDIATTFARTIYIDSEINNNTGLKDSDDISSQTDTPKSGVYNEYTLELANQRLSKLFSISDIISIIPVSPYNITLSTDTSSVLFEEGIRYGAILAAIPSLARERSESTLEYVSVLSNDMRERNGQLLELHNDNNTLTLGGIYMRAASILEGNINYYSSRGATIPAEADKALKNLQSLSSSMTIGKDTNVIVVVPENLSGWISSIDEAKEFLVDLTSSITNFWGDDPRKPSFVPSAHGGLITSYYNAHDEAYNKFVPDIMGMLSEVVGAVKYLVGCINSTGSCDSTDIYTVNADAQSLTFKDNLKISFSSSDSSGGVARFDFILDDGFLESGDTTFYWRSGTSSTGTAVEEPFIRLTYSGDYTVPPSFDVIEPESIAVVWPSLTFEADLSGLSGYSGMHAFNILFETVLNGINDPVFDQLYPANDKSEVRYNVTTLVFWVRSVFSDISMFIDKADNEEVVFSENLNYSAVLTDLRTTFSDLYYPSQKWPSNLEFFNPRSNPADEIPQMVRFFKGSEVVNGESVGVFDKELIGEKYISRIRVYEYDAATDSTPIQACSVYVDTDSIKKIQACSELTRLAGESTLESLISDSYEAGGLTNHAVKANGEYKIDLDEGGSGIVVDGEFIGIPNGETNFFTGYFSQPFELGIDTLLVNLKSQTLYEGEYIPIDSYVYLQRSTNDIYNFIVEFTYDQEYRLEGLDIPIGENLQWFKLNYEVNSDDVFDENGDYKKTIEYELGSLSIIRSGVVLSGSEELIAAEVSLSTDYTQGTAETGCGLNDRGKLSSSDDCDSVAVLTVRGATVGVIREERPNVFVARFVDGSWMVLGE